MTTSTTTSLFNPDLILFNIEAEDCNDLLIKLSEKLFKKGYVKESFEEAIIKREEVFPTGLPTRGVKIALPHTDAEHVLKSAVLITNLKKPVKFKEMGSGINDVEVEMVFMLAINQAKEQVGVLQKLIGLFSREEVLLKLKQSKDPENVLDILNEEIE